MTKPTEQEITTYLIDKKQYEQQTAITFADQFWNFYESKGWVVGRSPMKSWQAAIRTWEIKKQTNGHTHQSAPVKEGTSKARIRVAKEW